MKRQKRCAIEVRWLISGLALAGFATVQAIEPTGPVFRTAEALPLAVTQSIGDLAPLGGMIESPGIELVSAITHRSLFMKSRGVAAAQSAAKAQVQESKTADDLPEIELIGTLLSKRADVALVAEGPDRPRRLEVGDSVSDWKIVRIQRDNLMLKQNDTLAPVRLR